MDIIFVSFDDTLPVPALASPFALPRESVIDLFERGRALTQLQWHKDRVLIRPEDEDDWKNAEEVRRIVVEDVELYDFTGSIYEFNIDTERMDDLGYRAYFVPGGGIAVQCPATTVGTAADRIFYDLHLSFGKYAPDRLNSWAEYASQVPNLERVFALAGVERHEKGKQAKVAYRVDNWLAHRAVLQDAEGTVRADKLALGDVVDAADVRWWSHTTQRVTYQVSAIEPADNGNLTITFVSGNDRDRVLTVPANRRFSKVVDA
ncbi:hypothetical protein [Pseudarthrobacter sp. BIM B-2242]|uniref:hypothetical protein n=1 Tax=Pseudarthrobacter sp. BIM B-2242 TaxID=2772401 RepID=UPI00168B89AC|nr:hypothetical protein [Pseudarthrobacter sp. BIM B-2242]QOD06144.1 hypothetical protein IDT60_21535 [Pseudarthrobacter sp. BIM B-2242]